VDKPPEIATCPRCGKPFVPLPGSRWCSACTAQRAEFVSLVEDAMNRGRQTTLEGIADATGLAIPVVRRILKNTRVLDGAADLQVPCLRCGKAPAQPGSDLCLECRLDLGEKIAEAADELAAGLEQDTYESKAAKPVDNVTTRVDEQRRRTSVDALYPKRQRFK